MRALLALVLDNWQAVAGVLGAAFLYLMGRRHAGAARDAKDAKAYQKTMEAANEAPVLHKPSDAREWLRDRADKR